jgi:hypothetical protein
MHPSYLRTLAVLDFEPRHDGPTLLGALSIDAGRVIADPLRPTAAVIASADAADEFAAPPAARAA